MATETKYGIVVSQIPEDEPIILFRAQDKVLYYLLYMYALLCELLGSPKSHTDEIYVKLNQVENWQKSNKDKVKVPD